MRHTFSRKWTNPAYHPPSLPQTASYVYEYDCLPCIAPYSFDPQVKNCTKYCPPSKPLLNLETGQCEGEGPKQCEMTAGNPVVISTGEKVQQELPDFVGNKQFPLNFNRNYRSYRAPEANPQFSIQFNPLPATSFSNWKRYLQPVGYTGVASKYSHLIAKPWREYTEEDGSVRYQPPVSGHRQWRHSYDYRMYITGNRAILHRPTGTDLQFTKSGADYLSSQATGKRILQVIKDNVQTGWLYEFSGGLKELYDLNGKLIQLQKTESLYQTLAYNQIGQLVSVAHSFGGSIVLSYNQDGQLTRLSSELDGAHVNYSYDPVGNLIKVERQLESVPGTFITTETRQYHFEDSRYPYALTGITNEQGNRYVNWEYDNMGRVIENVKGDNQQLVSFNYNGELSTTVTNPLGKRTTYNFSNSTGDKRFTFIEGEASNNCMAANKSYSYYTTGTSKGLVHKQTNWKGVTTLFAYNPRGLEITRYDSFGTPEQKLTTTEWHATHPWPIKITAGNEVKEYRYDESGNVVLQRRQNK
ncbi:YD repeat [Shewanella denitrificans OS217]|uniref:YD repeat n=2 Tax=Shewanella TaxID=22 RepID=Q12LF1_SHEDO|nr:YD repeat [Shewanella denitrificans OS217]